MKFYPYVTVHTRYWYYILKQRKVWCVDKNLIWFYVIVFCIDGQSCIKLVPKTGLMR